MPGTNNQPGNAPQGATFPTTGAPTPSVQPGAPTSTTFPLGTPTFGRLSAPASTTPAAPAAARDGGFMGTVAGAIGPNSPMMKTAGDVAIGVDKQVARLPWDVASLGKNIANAAGDAASHIPMVGSAIHDFLSTPKGSPADLSTKAPDALQPKNTAEKTGDVLAQIAEFFIPGSAEKTAVTKISNAVNLIDDTKMATTLGPKATSIIKGLLNIVGAGAVTGASTAGVTAVQTGGDAEAVKNAGEVGFAAGAAGKAFELVAPGIMKSLQKADFKLSPSQEAKAANRAESAAGFMTDNKIVGSQTTKYKKLVTINQNFESALQSSLPENAGVKVQDIVADINSRVESLRSSDPAVYKAARAEADDAIKLLQEQGGENGMISMKEALNGKRSYGAAAFRSGQAAKIADPRVTTEGAYAVELGYQTGLESSMERIDGSVDIPKNLRSYFGGQSKVTLQEFNQVYSKAIGAKNLTFASQFKSDTGLVGRLFGLWAGEAVGQAVAPGLAGKIIGGAAGEIASSQLPGMVRNATERVAAMPASTIPTVAKGGLGIYNEGDTNGGQQ